ncbi:MAG TPA: FKBP-type peptidyl-prolyl cis-trans isomerase, partial [Saprospiraceae bacterium]|nr:FKBP-type peptidyl-prolyl cis-trans isomerase [Saprospiraceae bacterium]
NGRAQALSTPNDSLSYSLGVLIGKNLQLGGYENLNMDLFMTALKASMKNENTLLSSTKCKEYIELGASKTAMKQYESNRIAGEEFLTNNKKRTGVIALPNGLQYEVIKMGDGPKPKATDEVIVHYHGTLADGTIFDSSVERGESISFPLNGVIKGWTEILQLMPVGSKWKVFIPYQLAYGDRAAGPDIKPYSMLIFEIELLGIK